MLSQQTKAPGPRGLPLIGHALDAWKDPLELMLERRNTYGDVVRSKLGPHHVYLISSPEAIQHVLQKNAKNYVKSRLYDLLKPLLGRGLVTSEGDLWRRRRRIAQRSFSRQRLEIFTAMMADVTCQTIETWERTGRARGAFDVHSEMMLLAFRVVGKTLFSADVGSEIDSIARALERGLKLFDVLFPLLLLTPPWLRINDTLPIPGVRAVQRALDDVVLGIIRRRRQSGEQHDDLLTMFIEATDEDGSRLSDRDIRDELMTLILAGHETSAVSLSWTFYLLASDPDAQQRIAEEARDIAGSRTPSFDQVQALEYTMRVIQESMRLYPPAWGFGREPVEDDEICGYHVPKGALVQIVPFVLHRNPDIWDRPSEFDPDRFTPDKVEKRHRYAYIPFGAGPRLCIGRAFAMTEAALVVANVCARYVVELVPGQRIQPSPSVTLRPKYGIKIRLRVRE